MFYFKYSFIHKTFVGIQAKIYFDEALRSIAKSSKFIIKYSSSDGWDWWENRGVADEYTSSLIFMPVKSKESIHQKSLTMYKYKDHPTFAWVYDVTRASFVCTSEIQIIYITDMIKAQPTKFQIINLKNRFQKPSFTGYRDVLLHVLFLYEVDNKPYQFICEIQIHHIELLRCSNTLKSNHIYYYFREFFGDFFHMEENEMKTKQQVLKSMVQFTHNLHELESLIQSYFEINGSRITHSRWEALSDLFKITYEFSLREPVLKQIIKNIKSQLEMGTTSNSNFISSNSFSGEDLYYNRSMSDDSSVGIMIGNNDSNDEYSLPGSVTSSITSMEESLNFKHLLWLARRLLEHGINSKCLGKFPEAFELIQESNNLYKQLYSESKHEYLNGLLIAGRLLCAQELYSDGLELFQLSHQHRVNFYGREHPDTLVSLHEVADVLYSLERWNESRAAYEELLAAMTKIEGSSPEVAHILYCIGEVMEQQNDMVNALSTYEQATSMRESLFGGEHLLVAECLCAQAEVLSILGE